jgi:hypothetical protein
MQTLPSREIEVIIPKMQSSVKELQTLNPSIFLAPATKRWPSSTPYILHFLTTTTEILS